MYGIAYIEYQREDNLVLYYALFVIADSTEFSLLVGATINNFFFIRQSINNIGLVSLYFVYWIKYHQSTPMQTISSEIKQSV